MKKYSILIILLALHINIQSVHSIYECKMLHTSIDDQGNVQTATIAPVVGVKCEKGFLREDEIASDYDEKKQYCELKGGKFIRTCECNALSKACKNVTFTNNY